MDIYQPGLIFPDVPPPIPVPPGKKMGALPRHLSRHPDGDKPGQHCPYLSEHATQLGINIIPQGEWPGLIDELGDLTLEANSNWVYDQDGVGSCASEGACGILDVTRERHGLEAIRFNPWGTYQENDVSGGVDRGSTLGDNMRRIRETGAHPADLHPRSRGWRARPSEESYAAAKNYRVDEYYEVRTWTEAGSCVLQGWPVYTAYPGHAWMMLAVLDTRRLRWRNSWGTDWGDGGYGDLNASELQLNYGAYTARTPIEG
jgi:hypothetical protein